jgi:hypothetical protein
MRFRFTLPAIQIAVMVFILWAPSSRGAQWLNPGPTAQDWAEGINLASATIAIPVEFGLRGTDALPNYKIRFYGFWIVGLLCWYMVGRFVDDIVQWRRRAALPKKHPGDLAFALLAVPSALLLGGVFLFGESKSPVLAAWSVVWIVITCSALLFRVAQVIQQRGKRPVS